MYMHIIYIYYIFIYKYFCINATVMIKLNVLKYLLVDDLFDYE